MNAATEAAVAPAASRARKAIATRRTNAEKAVETARDALRTYVSQLG